MPHKEKDGPIKKPDPFDNPPSDLLITNIPSAAPSHILVLNKFPIIAEHFILATKTNKQQTHVLEQDDLEATYACLKAWSGDEAHGKQKRLFAFFNSGEHSGASQPHRHLQFLPVESMMPEQQAGGWDLLIDLILSSTDSATEGMVPGGPVHSKAAKVKPDTPHGLLRHPSLPFTHFACRLPLEATGRQLIDAYSVLYQYARQAVDDFITTNPNDFALHATDGGGSLPISYNLAMTTDGMAILPRRSEGNILRRDDGTEVGFVALNGTALGGTLMVKHQEEWDLLREQPEKLDSILQAIGFPSKTQHRSRY